MPDYYYNQKSVFVNKTVEVPFSFVAGRVSAVNAYSAAAWRNKIVAVLMTETGSRVWYDRYGASLPTLLTFETQREATSFLKEAINEAFIRWIPEVTLYDSLYTYDSSSATLTVTVTYRLPDGTEDRVSLTQTSTSSSGDALQVVWNG